jgi:hypothetical protein
MATAHFGVAAGRAPSSGDAFAIVSALDIGASRFEPLDLRNKGMV